MQPLLKQADERRVTMRAYENPAFVENLARKACLVPQGLEGIAEFRIACRNEEIIHTHNAVDVCGGASGSHSSSFAKKKDIDV